MSRRIRSHDLPVFLTDDEVMLIHRDVIEKHGGSFGVRNPDQLDSAVHSVQATFGSEFVYPSLFDMAAAYLFNLATSHPFVDGNKRTAWMTALVFLRRNNIRFKPRKDDAVELMVGVATGSIRSLGEVASWFEEQIGS